MMVVFDSHSTFNYLVLVVSRFKNKHDINGKWHRQQKRHDCMVSCDGSGCVTEPLVTASKAEVVFRVKSTYWNPGCPGGSVGRHTYLVYLIQSSDPSLCS